MVTWKPQPGFSEFIFVSNANNLVACIELQAARVMFNWYLYKKNTLLIPARMPKHRWSKSTRSSHCSEVKTRVVQFVVRRDWILVVLLQSSESLWIYCRPSLPFRLPAGDDCASLALRDNSDASRPKQGGSERERAIGYGQCARADRCFDNNGHQACAALLWTIWVVGSHAFQAARAFQAAFELRQTL